MDEKTKPEIRQKTCGCPPGGRETGAGLGTYPHTPLPHSAGAQKFKKIIPIGDSPMSLYFAYVVAWQRENPGKRFTMWAHRRVLKRIRKE